MKIPKIVLMLTLFTVIGGFGWIVASPGYGQGKAVRYPLRDGVYINLTEDFYRALRQEGDRASTTYSTDKKNDYLRQIAVSTKFMVETNLQILKQQEQMLRLLESIDKKRK